MRSHTTRQESMHPSEATGADRTDAPSRTRAKMWSRSESTDACAFSTFTADTVFHTACMPSAAKVSANAIREVGSNTFRHVLDLDLRYHSSRETGALTRYLDRGG